MNLQEQGVGYVPTVMANGVAVSEKQSFDNGTYPVGIFHPILTTSVALIFQVSEDGVTFVPMYDAAGARVTVIVAPGAAGYTVLSPAVFAGVRHMKVEVADNQAAERTFKLAVRGV
jgi:hypothetical protein